MTQGARNSSTRACALMEALAPVLAVQAWLWWGVRGGVADGAFGLALVLLLAWRVRVSGPADRRTFGLAAGADQRRSWRPLAAWTLLFVAFVLTWGVATDRWAPRRSFVVALLTYPLSGMAQQAVVFGYLYRACARRWGVAPHPGPRRRCSGRLTRPTRGSCWEPS